MELLLKKKTFKGLIKVSYTETQHVKHIKMVLPSLQGSGPRILMA